MTAKVNMKRFSRELMGKQVRFTKVLKRVGVSPREGDWTFEAAWAREVWTTTWEAREVGPKDRSTGWVVGLRWLLTGKREPGSGGGYDDDPPRFHETGPRILAYMVVPLPTMKPIPVPPDAIEVLPESFEPEFVDRETREFWSKESVNWDRDQLGKFAKAPPPQMCLYCTHRVRAGVCSEFPDKKIDAHDGRDCDRFNRKT